MNPSWLLKNTMQAHHLLAAYVIVWALQGGYTAWIVVQLLRLNRTARTPRPTAEADRVLRPSPERKP